MTPRRIACRHAAVAAALFSLVAVSARAEDFTGAIEVDGVALGYVTAEAGQPVLFLHGAISDVRAWEPYREGIAETDRFLAYTQRYFGTADWDDDGAEFSVGRHVQDLIAVIEALDVGPVHIVTWSYGGEVALQAMLDRPDLFRSAVHYEPYLPDVIRDIPGAGHAESKAAANFGPMEVAWSENRMEDATLRVIEAVFDWPSGSADDEPAAGMWRANARTLPLQFSMSPYRPLDCDTLSRIAVPSLLVQGAETQTRYSMMAEETAACLGNAMVVTLPGVTHDGPYRDPAALTALISAFTTLTR